MIILGRMLAWLGFISAIVCILIAAFRLHQGITGDYARAEALDDPLGSAIVYMMLAAVAWLLGMLAGHFFEEGAE